MNDIECALNAIAKEFWSISPNTEEGRAERSGLLRAYRLLVKLKDVEYVH